MKAKFIIIVVVFFINIATSLAQDRHLIDAINQSDENLQQLLPESKIKELVSSEFVIFDSKNSMLIAMQNGDFHIYGSGITKIILAAAKRGEIKFIPTKIRRPKDKATREFPVYNEYGKVTTARWRKGIIPCKLAEP